MFLFGLLLHGNKNSMEMNHPQKEYAIASHTTEHILNQTMIRLYACGRAVNAHIEKKKSKCDYLLPEEPSVAQVESVEKEVNAVIESHLPVTIEWMDKSFAKEKYNLDKLPDDASDTIRIVHIGDYDACPCIGAHVGNTSEIGTFKITTHSFENGVWRVRWKICN
jgi:alanyl-tRNA synthetase